MGEYSKRVGEVGEKVVVDFLKLIGWHDPQRNIDISSLDTEHRKYTNGLDGYFHYESPMITGTIENVLYSCKYSTDPYKISQLATIFKDHYKDLAKTIESFRKSTLNRQTQRLNENIDIYFDRGVLFWLNNSRKGHIDLLSRLSRVELTSNVDHDGIFLVDNRRIQFIYDTISYAKSIFNKSDGYEVNFIYFSNGRNNDDRNIRYGPLMPVQYINSSILPLLACRGNETTVIISVIDEFDQSNLMKYMGIAKNIGCNVQGATNIFFSDYLDTEHAEQVNLVKQAFHDSTFTSKLKVSNYNNPLLK